MRRDHGRCAVPGCGAAVFIDVHHINPRADGGGHDPDNLICLCGGHHRATRAGTLIIFGKPSTGLEFFRADGEPYGELHSPTHAEAYTDAFQALRGLGFSQTESRRALDGVYAHVGMGVTTQDLVRSALAGMPTSA